MNLFEMLEIEISEELFTNNLNEVTSPETIVPFSGGRIQIELSETFDESRNEDLPVYVMYFLLGEDATYLSAVVNLQGHLIEAFKHREVIDHETFIDCLGLKD
ncbi:hypothetical protein TUMSATVNIG1_60760 (plasmid) [Vibrio nigripulchritudo]|uniref:hypothetical protein n=1 Tax=Vibrio nigripulchritudo TaxID=28173 RepID=UPI00190BDA4E|nr:hypothetical protein [Vibrio nigripulchritudo]BCL74092.1 hypothetical protein VNTUMSATTG_60290 [Vibrio nigripulchritudo]BDU35467.1 hypothetical protein TUMSATVNIG1_60760 [Vibrio nigripulchritudo]